MNKIYLVFVVFLLSCDPPDERLKIENLTNVYVYYSFTYLGHLEKEYGAIFPFQIYEYEVDGIIKKDTVYDYRIPPGAERIVPYNSNWEIDIRNSSGKKLTVFIFKKETIENNSWDDIVSKDMYDWKASYSVEEINRNDWKILYAPD